MEEYYQSEIANLATKLLSKNAKLGEIESQNSLLKLKLRLSIKEINTLKDENEKLLKQHPVTPEKSIADRNSLLMSPQVTELSTTLSNLKWGFKKREEGLKVQLDIHKEALYGLHAAHEKLKEQLKNLCNNLCMQLDDGEEYGQYRQHQLQFIQHYEHNIFSTLKILQQYNDEEVAFEQELALMSETTKKSVKRNKNKASKKKKLTAKSSLTQDTLDSNRDDTSALSLENGETKSISSNSTSSAKHKKNHSAKSLPVKSNEPEQPVTTPSAEEDCMDLVDIYEQSSDIGNISTPSPLKYSYSTPSNDHHKSPLIEYGAEYSNTGEKVFTIFKTDEDFASGRNPLRNEQLQYEESDEEADLQMFMTGGTKDDLEEELNGNNNPMRGGSFRSKLANAHHANANAQIMKTDSKDSTDYGDVDDEIEDWDAAEDDENIFEEQVITANDIHEDEEENDDELYDIDNSSTSDQSIGSDSLVNGLMSERTTENLQEDLLLPGDESSIIDQTMDSLDLQRFQKKAKKQILLSEGTYIRQVVRKQDIDDIEIEDVQGDGENISAVQHSNESSDEDAEIERLMSELPEEMITEQHVMVDTSTDDDDSLPQRHNKTQQMIETSSVREYNVINSPTTNSMNPLISRTISAAETNQTPKNSAITNANTKIQLDPEYATKNKEEKQRTLSITSFESQPIVAITSSPQLTSQSKKQSSKSSSSSSSSILHKKSLLIEKLLHHIGIQTSPLPSPPSTPSTKPSSSQSPSPLTLNLVSITEDAATETHEKVVSKTVVANIVREHENINEHFWQEIQTIQFSLGEQLMSIGDDYRKQLKTFPEQNLKHPKETPEVTVSGTFSVQQKEQQEFIDKLETELSIAREKIFKLENQTLTKEQQLQNFQSFWVSEQKTLQQQLIDLQAHNKVLVLQMSNSQSSGKSNHTFPNNNQNTAWSRSSKTTERNSPAGRWNGNSPIRHRIPSQEYQGGSEREEEVDGEEEEDMYSSNDSSERSYNDSHRVRPSMSTDDELSRLLFLTNTTTASAGPGKGNHHPSIQRPPTLKPPAASPPPVIITPIRPASTHFTPASSSSSSASSFDVRSRTPEEQMVLTYSKGKELSKEIKKLSNEVYRDVSGHAHGHGQPHSQPNIHQSILARSSTGSGSGSGVTSKAGSPRRFSGNTHNVIATSSTSSAPSTPTHHTHQQQLQQQQLLQQQRITGSMDSSSSNSGNSASSMPVSPTTSYSLSMESNDINDDMDDQYANVLNVAPSQSQSILSPSFSTSSMSPPTSPVRHIRHHIGNTSADGPMNTKSTSIISPKTNRVVVLRHLRAEEEEVEEGNPLNQDEPEGDDVKQSPSILNRKRSSNTTNSSNNNNIFRNNNNQAIGNQFEAMRMEYENTQLKIKQKELLVENTRLLREVELYRTKIFTVLNHEGSYLQQLPDIQLSYHPNLSTTMSTSNGPYSLPGGSSHSSSGNTGMHGMMHGGGYTGNGAMMSTYPSASQAVYIVHQLIQNNDTQVTRLQALEHEKQEIHTYLQQQMDEKATLQRELSKKELTIEKLKNVLTASQKSMSINEQDYHVLQQQVNLLSKKLATLLQENMTLKQQVAYLGNNTATTTHTTQHASSSQALVIGGGNTAALVPAYASSTTTSSTATSSSFTRRPSSNQLVLPTTPTTPYRHPQHHPITTTAITTASSSSSSSTTGTSHNINHYAFSPSFLYSTS